MAVNESTRRFQQRLALIPKEIVKEIDASLLKQATVIGTAMKSVVERGDTGNLAASIRVQPQPLRVFIRAGGPLTTKPVKEGLDHSYDYALAMEFGTSDTPAEPFFYPIFRALKSRAQRAINRDLKMAIEKAAKKP